MFNVLKKRFGNLFYNVVSKVNKPVEFPHGIKIILWYTLFLGITAFLLGFLFPLLYPQIFQVNPFIVLFNFVFLIVSVIIFKGILKRRIWAYKLILIWYVVAISYNFLYFFTSFDIFDVLSDTLLIGLVFSFIINSTVLWYLIVQKEFFLKRGLFLRHKRIKIMELNANDHIFMVVFISFWFVSLLVLAFSSYQVLDETFEVTDEVISDFNVEGYDISICEKGDFLYKDVCYMTYAIKKEDSNYCSYVKSSFYKFTCLLGV